MEIHELKSRLTIHQVAERLGIHVGRNDKALCPFHNDKTPSLQFSKEKNICTCFSSNCDAGTMDIITLTEKKLNLNTHEAILQLKAWAGLSADKAGAVAPPGNNGKRSSLEIRTDSPVNDKAATGTVKGYQKEDLSRIALLTKAFHYYENGMRTSRKAKDYLADRGLRQKTPNQEGVELGFNSGNFHQRENKYLLESAVKYGLLIRTERGHVAFGRDCLVFPLRNADHKITSFYFRDTGDEKKESRHYYLKDRQGLYPGYPQGNATRLILTESVIDAASLLQLESIRNSYTVLACYGTNGFTAEHAELVNALKQLKEIIFFFDGDASGRQGVKKAAQTIQRLLPGIAVTEVATPEGEDVNSLYVGHQERADELFAHLLESRTELSSSLLPEDLSGENKKKEKPDSLEQTLDTSNPHKLKLLTGTGIYYVLGGLRADLDSMRVSLLIESLHTRGHYRKYRNKADLYENKQVERMAREVADKLDLRVDLVELDLHRLTDLLEAYRESLVKPKESHVPEYILDRLTEQECRAFLSKPKVVDRLNTLIGKAGVVGEVNNRIFLFCIATSYKMPDTLHALIQGSTGSGKTHLLVKVSSFIPEEDVKRFTRVTDGSFYNYGTYDLQHKLVCLEDLDGMKEEAQLAFRELQSREMLSSSTTGQDEKGNIRAYEKVVYGPIASLACTTKGEIYEDNMSRCFLLAVDESSDQTQRIIAYQNRKAAGSISEEKEKAAQAFLKDCIRMLKPYKVINPYADKVQLPEEAHKIRRLNDLYQSFVKQVALINQYRRERDARGRLVAGKEDLQVAAEIMFDSIVLKIDELDGSLRDFYERLKGYIKGKGESYASYSFGQREVRQALRVSKSQLQRYIHDLLSLEYIYLSGGHVNKGYTYKVVYWDDVARLKGKVKRHLQGQLDQLELLENTTNNEKHLKAIQSLS